MIINSMSGSTQNQTTGPHPKKLEWGKSCRVVREDPLASAVTGGSHVDHDGPSVFRRTSVGTERPVQSLAQNVLGFGPDQCGSIVTVRFERRWFGRWWWLLCGSRRRKSGCQTRVPTESCPELPSSSRSATRTIFRGPRRQVFVDRGRSQQDPGVVIVGPPPALWAGSIVPGPVAVFVFLGGGPLGVPHPLQVFLSIDFRQARNRSTNRNGSSFFSLPSDDGGGGGGCCCGGWCAAAAGTRRPRRTRHDDPRILTPSSL